MKDFKKVLKYIGQMMEVNSLLPTKFDSRLERKQKLADHIREANYAKVNTPGIIKLKAFCTKLFIHLIITIIVLYVGNFGYSLPIFIGVTMLLFCIEYAIVCFCWEIRKVIKEDGLIKGLIQAILLLLFLASIPYFS
ncbi:hypothetical protein [Clostridium tagluense]|uniref:hypothetical protein n=1 Tax=Clostridium tagluense TaxID=360422 RepID=UPI001C0CB318|nr:hypothetical protein [Clostridium tagluense]MBU3128940.1 hypothetical protein [Clostridium tagluense]